MSDAAFRLEKAGLIVAAMALWQSRMDTAQMARVLNHSEAEVSRALRIGRELRSETDD